MMRTFALRVAAAAAVGISVGMSTLAYAQNPSVQVAPEALEKWVGELDSDNFDARQEATRRIVAAGKQAIPYAVKAAQGHSIEVSSRAVGVLKKLLQSEDKPTQAAATEALKGLSKSDNKALAGRAMAALIEVFGEPNRLSRLKVHVGNKRIEFNGDANGIKVTLTETVDGKDETSIFKATDIEELKKNHPEGHKLYEKYFERSQRRELEEFWHRIENESPRK